MLCVQGLTQQSKSCGNNTCCCSDKAVALAGGGGGGPPPQGLWTWLLGWHRQMASSSDRRVQTGLTEDSRIPGIMKVVRDWRLGLRSDQVFHENGFLVHEDPGGAERPGRHYQCRRCLALGRNAAE